jgi:predicted permease
MAPAFRASSVEVNRGLREGRSGTASKSRMLASRALVVVQVSLSLLLLIGAGLFIRSFRNLENIDTGFNRDQVALVSLETDAAGYAADDKLSAIYSRLEARVRRIPGVRSATLSMFAFDEGQMSLTFHVEGHPEVASEGKSILVNVTGVEYPETTGTPLITGRYFTAHDTAASAKVAVIGEKAARDIFGNASPLGKRLSFDALGTQKDMEIVGVMRDVKYTDLRETTPWAIFVPYTQRHEYISNLLGRTTGAPAALAPQLRAAVEETDRNLPVSEVTTLGDLVDRSLNTEQLIARLSGFFGGLALLLSAMGLYGILSYSVMRRTSEIGVRMALGAQSRGVQWMILRETLALLGIGVALGLPAAIACSRLIESMLYGLKPGDAATMAGAVLVLVAMGTLAGLLPARRASRVDPMVALRYE